MQNPSLGLVFALPDASRLPSFDLLELVVTLPVSQSIACFLLSFKNTLKMLVKMFV